MSQKKSIYIESTIPSYITADDSKDEIILGRQKVARKFWNTKRTEYDLFISMAIVNEIGRGDPVYAKKRLDLVEGIERLKSTPEIDNLAEVYKKIMTIPERARLDAVHLAVAVTYNIDYVLSFNFSHMGVEAYGVMLRYNDKHGFHTPLLITPDYFFPTEVLR